MTPRLLFVHALSPLHAGTGQSIGAIELAIARDRATGFPYLPGSSLKGSLRDRAQRQVPDKVVRAFGPDTANASDHAGALLFGDANLLLLPVRSIRGTFAYVTSPYLLQRYARDANEAKLPLSAKANVANKDACLIATEKSSLIEIGKSQVVFEDLDFQSKTDPAVDEIGKHLGALLFPNGEDADWKTGLIKRLCIVHDDVMAYLSEHATDVVTRVALEDETKTVKPGQLWHEENLPTETILVSLVAELGIRKGEPGDAMELLQELSKEPIQLGGKATVGRGRCRLVLGGTP